MATAIKLNYQNHLFNQHLDSAISVIGTNLSFAKSKLDKLVNNDVVFFDPQNLLFYGGMLRQIISADNHLFNFYSTYCPNYYEAANMKNLLVVQGLHVIDDKQSDKFLTSDPWWDFVITSRVNRQYI